MNLRPTIWTAAAAGTFTAIAWPLLSARYGGSADGLGLERIVLALVVIALPAHLLVVGLRRDPDAPPRSVDTKMAKRILAWIGAVLGVTLARLALGA